jgi:UPF0755 protein
MTKLIAKLFFTLLFLCLLALVLVVIGQKYLQEWANLPLAISIKGHAYELKPGQSLSHLAVDLERDGVIKSARLLRLYARINGISKVRAGEYVFPAGTTIMSLLEKIQKGEVKLYQVVFLEGWTVSQVLKTLAEEKNLQHTLRDKTNKEILSLLNIPSEHLEGWIFPDTYAYEKNTSDLEILQQAYKKMTNLLQAEWDKRAADLPYKNAYEALIMASIIERETGHHLERDQIAGVFVRRLQKGMKLQTDPTVIYGMGDSYKGRISRKNLKTPTAYNTYVIAGLPPTPISLPSAASIKAALNPAQGDALYFVAKGDGTSKFSATLDEHNRAVRQFQLKRRSDYRAAPPVNDMKNQNE